MSVLGLLCLGLAPISVDAAGFGAIRGRLVLAPGATVTRELLIRKGDPTIRDAPACCGRDIFVEPIVVDRASRGVADGIAYVVEPGGINPEAERALVSARPEVVVRSDSCQFVPHTSGVYLGQTLAFEASDGVPHNVRDTGRGDEVFNVVLAKNRRITRRFAKASRGPVTFSCDIHGNRQEGEYMVFDHPFFAVTAADGSFEIKGIPAGARRLIVRHREVGYVTAGGSQGLPVDVREGGTTDVGHLRLVPRNLPPTAPKAVAGLSHPTRDDS